VSSTIVSSEHEELVDGATQFLVDPRSRRDAWEFLARARAAEPVLQSGTGVWLVTGYAAANEVLRNDAILSRREAGLKHVIVEDREARLIYTSRMLYNDRPEHTRLRRLVSHAFTRAAVVHWEGRVRQLANERLDAMLPTGRMELVHDYAYPAVEQIITEMLGIRHGDLALFLKWSAAMTEPPPGGDVTRFRDVATQATYEVAAYVRERIAEHRDHPADDLLTKLIEAEDAEDGRLAEHELIAMTFELIFAGHETTSNFVSNGVYCLLKHPEQLAALQADRSLLSGAIDEMLRYESPAPFPLPRVATEDVLVGGRRIAKGDTVVVALSAANRDPAVFADPERFDIRRSPNDYISFGFGAHYCLGHALARIESTELLNAILDRVPTLRSDGDAQWSDHQFFRSLTTLPVTW
jgi:cytochrome P450